VVLEQADALANRAAALNEAELYEDAEAAARAALALEDGHWAALANLGTALHRQFRYGEAISAYVAALRACPGNVNACTNLGVALNEMGAMGPSLEAHDAAVMLAPGNAQVRANRAMARLMAGDLAGGFAEFEARWELVPHGMAGPMWQGEDIRGRRILVWDEGGYGDTLQFIRYVAKLLALGPRVVLRVQAPLARLARMSFPGVEAVLTHEDALPEYDVHCPMISLAQVFGTTLETVPAELPYLHPDTARVAFWRGELERLEPGLRVGLTWAGAPRPGMPQVAAMDRRRSLHLPQLAPLLAMPGVRWVSLQIGGSAEIASTGAGMLDAMEEMRDFADTAALAAGLDLVISVDTAVAHLAGGLGRPTWVLSRFDACWRWLAGREDTPWYPGMRVLRQSAPGDWGGVIERVADALTAWREAD
jgi:tetratricopeptide (TPR) repeat protein